MARSWEHEAMKIKYECQMPITIRVEVREDKDPNARTKNVMSWGGGQGYVNIHGMMTEDQRSKFIQHIEKYIKLLFSEAESAVKFRREWDATEDEIEGRERIVENISVNGEKRM